MKKVTITLSAYQMLWMGEACRNLLPDPRQAVSIPESVTWWMVYELYLKHWNKAVYEKDSYRLNFSVSEAMAVYYFLLSVADDEMIMQGVRDTLDWHKVNL